MGRTRQGPVEGSVEQDRVVEQVRHFVRGACQTVEQADESKRPPTEHPNRRFSPADRRVDKTDEFPWRDGMGAGDVDGAAVSRRRRDEFQHRLGGIVDEDEFVRCVRIQWPSAWLPVDGSLKNRPEDLMHDARTVEVRIPRQDQSHPPVAVGLEEHLLNMQPHFALLGVRLPRMVFQHGPRSRVAVDVHVARERQDGSCRLRRRERILRERRHKSRPLGVRDIRRVHDHVGAAGGLDHRLP